MYLELSVAIRRPSNPTFAILISTFLCCAPCTRAARTRADQQARGYTTRPGRSEPTPASLGSNLANVGSVSIDGDGSWRSKVEVEVDGGVGWPFWAIKKAKKSEKNITITTASGFEPRTLKSAGFVWPVPRRAAVVATSAHLTFHVTCICRIYTKAQRQTRQVKKLDLRRPAARLVGK